MGVDQQRFLRLVLESMQHVLRSDGWDEVVDEICELGVVGGLLLDEGADLLVDELHYIIGWLAVELDLYYFC